MKFWSNADIPIPGQHSPEKRLLAAVLQRAITDLVGGQGDVKDSARSWLLEEDCADAPLTFGFICEALDLDSRGLKKAIFSLATTQPHLIANEAAF